MVALYLIKIKEEEEEQQQERRRRTRRTRKNKKEEEEEEEAKKQTNKNALNWSPYVEANPVPDIPLANDSAPY